MKTLTAILVTAACISLAAPSFASDRISAGKANQQILSADLGAQGQSMHEFSSGQKIVKKKRSKRSWWGG